MSEFPYQNRLDPVIEFTQADDWGEFSGFNADFLTGIIWADQHQVLDTLQSNRVCSQ